MFVHCSFLKYPDKRVEAVERNMNETVFLLYLGQDTVVSIQFFFQDRRPLRIFQITSSTIGKLHKILVILVTSAGYHRIQLVQIHLLQDTSEHIFRHARIVDDTQRFSTTTAFYSFRNLLQRTGTQVVVYFHFRITRKLEGISLEIRILQSLENQRQAATDYIIQIDQITFLFMIRQTDESSANVYRKFKKGIVGNLFRTLLTADFHCQINILVIFKVEISDSRKPDGDNRTAQLFLVI